MPSIKAVKHRDGTVVYRVRYRAGSRNPVMETFYDAGAAQRYANLVDRIGGAAAREMRSLDDLAAGGLEPLHHVGEDRFGSLLEQRGPVRVLGSPGPVRRIEVLREPDARRVVLLLSHGDHRPGRRKERAAP